MGEALSRCPRLALVPPDPVGVADAWEHVLARLESVGAVVESDQPGQACFAAAGLRRLHGGSLDGVVAATRAALRRPARIGAGPSRFCALAAAARARTRRAGFVRGAEDLAAEPVSLLRLREPTASLPQALERFGITTLGELAALPRAALADRFGHAGLLAHDLAFSPNGKRLWLTYDDRSTVAVFDPGWPPRRLFTVQAGSPPQHVAFGRYAYVTSGNDGRLRVFSLRGRLHSVARTPAGSFNLGLGGGLVLTPSLTQGTLTQLRGGNGAFLWTRKIAPAARDAAFAVLP